MTRSPITPGRWDTIALIGKAPSSQDLIPGIPEGVGLFGIGACWNLDNLPRELDMAVEIHPRWFLTHPNYSPGLHKWLEAEHPFPIFTQRREKDWPSSVKYPLERVIRRFCTGVTRGPGEAMVKYFSSSLDWLLAISLLYRPKRIEIYGYDMMSGSEYAYQREGMTFWMGQAAGMGIKVWIPESSPVLKGEMYGYEGAQSIHVDYLAEIEARERAGMDATEAQFKALAAAVPQFDPMQPVPEDVQQYYTRMGAVRDMHFLHSGAVHALEQLKQAFSVVDIVSRQELEIQYTMVGLNRQRFMSSLNWREGIVQDRFDRWKRNQALESWGERFKAEFEEADQDKQRARDTYFTQDERR